MSDPNSEKPIDLGVYGRGADPNAPRIGRAELFALALSILWLGLCLVLYTRSDGVPADGAGGLSVLLTAAAVLAPVLLVWIAALMLRSLRRLQTETAELREAMSALRQAQLALQQATGAARRPAPEIEPVEAHRPRVAAASPAQPAAPRRPAAPTAPAAKPPAVVARTTADGQALLAFDTPQEPTAEPMPMAELILALNFPDDAEDEAAIFALKLALQDRDTAKLIRAAQDVLTLLGHDGIYMDNLQPDRARPEVWRRFAGGERGRGVAALGGIRDREVLAAITARMRQDPVFRDAAHHFLRSFDRHVSTFADRADDPTLSAFAETRTAKAFMLIGRVTGTFD